MRKVIGAITARMTSTRLPGKVLMDIAGKSSFAHHVERMRKIDGLAGVFLLTSADADNKPLIAEAERLGCGWLEGAEEDVVDRHVALCERESADAVIRVTGDCPLFDIDSAAEFTRSFREKYRDFIFASNLSPMYGTLSECISYKALLEVHKHYRGPAVSLTIRERLDEFDALGIEIPRELCRPEYRLTVDYEEDLEVARRIYSALYRGAPLSLLEVYKWLDDNPETGLINKEVAVKGINLYAARLMEKSLYSVVRAGGRCLILDEEKRPVKPAVFLEKIRELFPELGRRP